jgi:ATP-dependent DNA ligase
VSRLRGRSLIIDGEAVACGDDGIPDFDRLRYCHHDDSVLLCAFDLIEVDGDDLRHEPLVTRKATLASLLSKRRRAYCSTSLLSTTARLLPKPRTPADHRYQSTSIIGFLTPHHRQTPSDDGMDHMVG